MGKTIIKVSITYLIVLTVSLNFLQEFDLKDICEEIIDSAHTIGVKIVDKIDPIEYGKFLEERAKIVEEELAEIKAAKEAKLLRT